MSTSLTRPIDVENNRNIYQENSTAHAENNNENNTYISLQLYSP